MAHQVIVEQICTNVRQKRCLNNVALLHLNDIVIEYYLNDILIMSMSKYNMLDILYLTSSSSQSVLSLFASITCWRMMDVGGGFYEWTPILTLNHL
jgi:hypothetical protein